MGLAFLFLLVFRRFLQNQKNLRENQKYKENQRKPQNLRKNKKNKVFKGFRLTLGYGFVFAVFPQVFTKPTNPSRKPTIPKKTKEYQQNIRKNQQNKVFKGFRPTLGYGFVCFCFVFPKVFTKPKNHSRKPKLQKTTTKTLGKTNKTKQKKHIQGWV